jgi:malonyl-CoA/methylmalonyl-CoA synthetase
MVGNKIILRKKFDPKDVLETIQQKQVTLFMGVPTMYFKLLEENNNRHDLSSMRLFISGSAPLSKELFHRFKQTFGFEILERAGMSETMINFSNPVYGKRIPGSVGFPLPMVQVRIVNDQLQDQPLNTEGEIVLRGENVFHCYWNNPEANAQSFCNGWFLTGDIGKIDEAGYVYIAGRKKDVIKSGGILIFPKEIEEVIETMPGVKECAVVGVADEKFGEAIKACVVLDCEKLSADALILFCKQHLASFKKPKHVEFFKVLPKNAMGKILKEELRKNHSVVS